jgi:hypothetical protein
MYESRGITIRFSHFSTLPVSNATVTSQAGHDVTEVPIAAEPTPFST